MSEVASVSVEDFEGAARHDGTMINAWLRGTADYAALDAIDMLLSRIHVEANRLGVKEAVVDLRQLEFMNSSCFKSFVSWINDIQGLEQERRYKIKFLANPKLHWQRRSLTSLRCFAVDLVSVTESQ